MTKAVLKKTIIISFVCVVVLVTFRFLFESFKRSESEISKAIVRETWSDSIARAREYIEKHGDDEAIVYSATELLNCKFPVESHWARNIGGINFLLSSGPEVQRRGLIRALNSTQPSEDKADSNLKTLLLQELLRCYEERSQSNRKARLTRLAKSCNQFIFVKQRSLTGYNSFDDLSADLGGEELCLLNIEEGQCVVKSLIRDKHGDLRDPFLSYDAKKLLFSWRKGKSEFYHIYEYNLDSGEYRQLTSDKACDIEPIYLPDGNILFASTRCSQTLVSRDSEVINLYKCDSDGKQIKRVTFDYTHNISPAILDDGRVIYSRWYESLPQFEKIKPVMQMNPDGTGQRVYHWNRAERSRNLIDISHAPDATNIMGVAQTGDGDMYGDLVLIDRTTKESSGEIRDEMSHNVLGDGYYMNPCQMQNKELLVSYADKGQGESQPHFNIYYTGSQDWSELLVFDGEFSCTQLIPLKPRNKPFCRPSLVNYTKNTARCYIHDVYATSSLGRARKGSLKRLRVVGVEFKPAAIGKVLNDQSGRQPETVLPIGVGNTARHIYHVMGEVTVYPDGSVLFEVPAHAPFYLQVLDDQSCALARSSRIITLQPGEFLSTLSLDIDNEISVDSESELKLAMKHGIEQLDKAKAMDRGIDFVKDIKPIIEKYSVYDLLKGEGPTSFDEKVVDDTVAKRKWSLLYLNLLHARPVLDSKTKKESYVASNECPALNWQSYDIDYVDEASVRYGSKKSEIIRILEKNDNVVSEDLDKLKCWIDLQVPYCGEYTNHNIWSQEEIEYYDGRIRNTLN